MSAHTHGRMTAFTSYAEPELRDENDKLFAVLPSWSAADARRLAACWNACTGVETELLESYSAPFSKLREQRDELLSAIKNVLVATDSRDIDAMHVALGGARVAVANTECQIQGANHGE